MTCIAASAFAGAQMSGASGVSGRIGFFFPSNSQAHDAGAEWLSFGLDYRLNNLQAPAMVTRAATGSFFSLSADYYDKGSFRNIPVALNYNVRAQQLIFSAGLGGEVQTVFDHETIGLGAQVGVTYEFTSGHMSNVAAAPGSTFFVQAKYFLASNSTLDGIGVFVGMRF